MKVKAILIPVEGPPVLTAEETLEDIQRIVGGYVEALSLADDLTGWINDDGKAMGLPRNARATGFYEALGVGVPGDFIAGPMLLTGPANAEGDETDVPEKWINALGVTS